MSKKATSKPEDDQLDDQQPDEQVETVEADWLAEDYDGPLDAVQAAARLKRHGQHVTKPATEAVTK